jgi:ankyrin repeat protein
MKENFFELVRKGILDVNALPDEHINQRSDSGSGATLLQEAIASRQDAIALALIERGIDLDAQDNEKRTALFFAATYQNKVVTEALINAGATINIADRHGNGPLWAALLSSRKDYDLFEYILSKGGDPFSKNTYGKSCADFARKDHIQMLLDILGKYVRI